MNARKMIITLVTGIQNPSLDDVCRIDNQDSSMIRYLIQILIGQESKVTPNLNNKSLVFVGTSGTTFLTIQKDSEGKNLGLGELAHSLNALLAAIRIHEVDSYEWTYLPPETRQSLVNSRAQEVGISHQEFKRLMSIWIA